MRICTLPNKTIQWIVLWEGDVSPDSEETEWLNRKVQKRNFLSVEQIQESGFADGINAG